MLPSSAKARILYVDDLPDWRKQVGDLLTEYGYDVVCVESPEEALLCLDTNGPFDLGIIDLRLVEQDPESGAKLAKDIRLRELELPIIILTAFGKEMSPQLLMQLGWDQIFVVEKSQFNIQNENNLLYRIEKLVPWQKRSMYCFIAMPFQEEFNDVDEVIKVALAELGIKALRVDDNRQAGDIPNEIRRHLRHNSFVIADLSYQNPNVMYEIGFAEALGRPVLLLCQELSTLPEFLTRNRSIAYNTRYTGIEELRESLRLAVWDTLEKSTITLQSKKRPFASAIPSYVPFMPKTDLGHDVWREIVLPVIERQRLEEIKVYEAEIDASTRQERWLQIQQSTMILAEITEGDPETYYYVGASDALKGKCVLLLLKEGVTPPFNMRDRAATIRYDYSTRRKAMKAQRELANRVRACLSAVVAASDITIEELDSFANRKKELAIKIYDTWKQTTGKLDVYVKEQWTADQRHRRQALIEEVKGLLRGLADDSAARIEKAMSPEQLAELAKVIDEEAAGWYDEALKHIYR